MNNAFKHISFSVFRKWHLGLFGPPPPVLWSAPSPRPGPVPAACLLLVVPAARPRPAQHQAGAEEQPGTIGVIGVSSMDGIPAREHIGTSAPEALSF